jgi:(4-O-methyl)-D-glucuronate---lignin esterase
LTLFKQRLASTCLLSILGVIMTSTAPAQSSAAPPTTFTADQDHQNMMDQLGIKALRPGPSGDEKAPNHANYDESKANPYPNVVG